MSGAGCSSGSVQNFKIIDSRRGGRTLLHAGHKYLKLRENKKTIIWHCINKRNKIKCTGKLILDSKSYAIVQENKHNSQCEPNFEDNEVQIAVSECMKEVSTNYISVQKTFEKHMRRLRDMGYHLSGSVPDYKSAKSKLYRYRNKSLKVQKTQFNNPAEVIIPEEFRKYLLNDYCCEGGNRIIIFTSTEIGQHIKGVTHFFGDGTFDGCPTPFKQVYVIHGDMGSTDMKTNVAPLFYVLLYNKESETYEKMFKLIKEALPEFGPSKFTFDYEKGAINAAARVFLGIEINGCNIHFQKNVIKKAKSLNIMEHEETKKHVKKCMSLAFLPKEDIEDGWLYIMETRYIHLMKIQGIFEDKK